MNYATLNPYKDLLRSADSKIVLLVIDGLGGVPHPDHDNKTELEVASIPNLDTLAKDGMTGGHIPVRSGVTPGSVDAHISVFGFDPLEVEIGRGAAEAAGVGFDLGPDDIAARCNWTTLKDGKIADRRAGRKGNDYYAPLIQRLQDGVHLKDAEVFIVQGAEHRFVTVIRKKGLGQNVSDTDPQQVGHPPLSPEAHDKESEETSRLVQEFIDQAFVLLKDEEVANGFTMRGFSKKPSIPSFREAYGLHAAGIATHPLYKGLGKLFGMDVLSTQDKQPEDVLEALTQSWNEYDFFYLHLKWPDSKGEDGDFDGKVENLEKIDAIIPEIQKLGPTVLCVTGDHCTPAAMALHSWHPVPTLIWGDHVIADAAIAFTERSCVPQGLNVSSNYAFRVIMPNLLAHSGRLKKYGP